MSFTGLFGTVGSQLADLLFGALPSGGANTPGTAASTLSLSDLATGIKLSGGSASSTLSLSDAAVGHRTAVRTVSDTLTLSDIATQHTTDESASSTLSLSGVAVGTKSTGTSGSSTMSLSDAAVGARVTHKTVSDTMTLTDVAIEHTFFRSVNDTVSFSQTLSKISPVYQLIVQNMPLFQPASAHPGVTTQSVSFNLNLTDLAGREVDVSVSDPMSLSQDGHRATVGVDTLALTQTAIGAHGNDVADTITFVDTAAYTGLLTRHLTAALGISDSVTYSATVSEIEFIYSPFIGSNGASGAPTPPSGTLFTPATGQPDFMLFYPSSGPVSSSVSTRAPNFNNRDQLAFNRVNRETMGGTLIIFADPGWPKVQTLLLQFSSLKRSQMQALRTFIRTYIGQYVGLLDWDGRYWTGIISNPNEPFVQDTRDTWSASFDFQGTPNS